MTEIRSRQWATLADRYRIEFELGGGGTTASCPSCPAGDLDRHRGVTLKALESQIAAGGGSESSPAPPRRLRPPFLFFALSPLLFSCSDPGAADDPEAAPRSESPSEITADLVVRGATLIDGTGSAPRPNTDIFVTDGVITAVRESGTTPIPEDATEIDAGNAFVMPGLADMHVHFRLGLPGPQIPGETDEVLRRFLYYGVTTVLNLGATDGSTDAINDLRARQASGALLAPTIYGSGGHITLPGTHPIWTIFPPPVRQAAADMMAGSPADEPVDLSPMGLGFSIVRSIEAARRAVRERAEGGMEVIKIMVESGPSAFGDDHPLMPEEMIRAIVDEAAASDLPVVAHVSSTHELDSVVMAGAAAIAHAVSDPPYPDAASRERFAAEGLYAMGTLALSDAFIRYAEDPSRIDDPFLRQTLTEEEVAVLRRARMLEGSAPPESLPARRAQTDSTIRAFTAFQNLGIPIVLGSDVGNPRVFPGHSAHEELSLMVAGGLSPMEAIQAASRNAARLMNREDEFGTVQVGRRADLLVLDANPLDDIENTRSIRNVIARGQVIDRERLLAR